MGLTYTAFELLRIDWKSLLEEQRLKMFHISKSSSSVMYSCTQLLCMPNCVRMWSIWQHRMVCFYRFRGFLNSPELLLFIILVPPPACIFSLQIHTDHLPFRSMVWPGAYGHALWQWTPCMDAAELSIGCKWKLLWLCLSLKVSKT